MIPRRLSTTLLRLAKGFPVVVVTGPRQSGKTTLVRATFSTKPYVSLENPDIRQFAVEDGRRFLAAHQALEKGPVNIIAQGGDGSTSDIDFQCIRGCSIDAMEEGIVFHDHTNKDAVSVPGNTPATTSS